MTGNRAIRRAPLFHRAKYVAPLASSHPMGHRRPKGGGENLVTLGQHDADHVRRPWLRQGRACQDDSSHRSRAGPEGARERHRRRRRARTVAKSVLIDDDLRWQFVDGTQTGLRSEPRTSHVRVVPGVLRVVQGGRESVAAQSAYVSGSTARPQTQATRRCRSVNRRLIPR